MSVLERFSLPPSLPGFTPRYNIAPSQDQWTISLGDSGKPVVRPRRWGLIPSWAKDPSIGSRMINARAESLSEKPSYRIPLEEHRCLVLADGYYEWMTAGRTKTPFFFHLTGHRAFTMAGLWERWGRGEESIETCTIITTAAGYRTSSYHHRTPVLFTAASDEEWLDGRTSGARALELLVPYDADDLACYEVSGYVNNPANDSPACIAPLSDLRESRPSGIGCAATPPRGGNEKNG